MPTSPTPTDRELQILNILWERNEATVRKVFDELCKDAPIVQNTVQAFLRTMEEKGLVEHRTEGRTFIYRPIPRRDETKKRMVSRILQRAFDGAIDQLVQSALSLRQPTTQEIRKLEELIEQAKAAAGKKGGGRS
jgi:predicted transcriptional regulator